LCQPLYRLRDTPEERLLAADLSYVYLRNAGILLNAEEGLFDFDFRDITRSLVERFSLSVCEAALVAQLRELKSAYRERRLCLAAEPPHTWISICEKVGGSASSQTDLHTNQCYGMLREIEAVMVQRWGLATLDCGGADRDVARIWKVVTSPREYRWQVRRTQVLAIESERLLTSSPNRYLQRQLTLKPEARHTRGRVAG
jgi:hypothetical protein